MITPIVLLDGSTLDMEGKLYQRIVLIQGAITDDLTALDEHLKAKYAEGPPDDEFPPMVDDLAKAWLTGHGYHVVDSSMPYLMDFTDTMDM